MNAETRSCPSCGSTLTVQLSNVLHCNACGADTHVESALSGTPLNPRRGDLRHNPLRIGAEDQ